MKRKILITSLFATLMLLVPMTSAVDINTDVNDDAKDNYETEPLDEPIEKISFICGGGSGTGASGQSVNISSGNIFIIAFTTNGSYIKITNQVYIEYFIGFCNHGSFGGISVCGFAFGNIDW
jgi:hypothetical protein